MDAALDQANASGGYDLEGGLTALAPRLEPGGTGIANLGRGGAVNGDGNWWGCTANPNFPISAFAGCAVTSGPVSVTSWTLAPISK